MYGLIAQDFPVLDTDLVQHPHLYKPADLQGSISQARPQSRQTGQNEVDKICGDIF